MGKFVGAMCRLVLKKKIDITITIHLVSCEFGSLLEKMILESCTGWEGEGIVFS